MPTILITGANRGLGFELARQYAADGATVIAGCRSPAKAQALQRLAHDSRGAVDVFEVDVADTESVQRAAAHVNAARIDILINCAGIIGTGGRSLGSLDYRDWMQVLEVNLMGPARISAAFLERVAASERKLIVTITSGMGSLADNTSGGYIPYRTSKAAVNMLMRSAALDLKTRGISCVLINPGWVRTDMGGPNAQLAPEESVTAMRRVIAKLGPADSGRFYNHDGREYSW